MGIKFSILSTIRIQVIGSEKIMRLVIGQLGSLAILREIPRAHVIFYSRFDEVNACPLAPGPGTLALQTDTQGNYTLWSSKYPQPCHSWSSPSLLFSHCLVFLALGTLLCDHTQELFVRLSKLPLSVQTKPKPKAGRPSHEP
jgi:hypothetical protein